MSRTFLTFFHHFPTFFHKTTDFFPPFFHPSTLDHGSENPLTKSPFFSGVGKKVRSMAFSLRFGTTLGFFFVEVGNSSNRLKLQLLGGKFWNPSTYIGILKEDAWLLQPSWSVFGKYLEVKMGWFFEGPYPFSVACGRQNTCNQNTKQAP